MTEEEKKALAASLRGIERAIAELKRAIAELHHNSILSLLVAADNLDPPDLPEPSRSGHYS